jgi:hypothetical protein
MTSKAQLDLELRLMAIEYVVAQLGKMTLITAGVTSEQAAQMRANGRAAMLKQTFPGDACRSPGIGPRGTRIRRSERRRGLERAEPVL